MYQGWSKVSLAKLGARHGAVHISPARVQLQCECAWLMLPCCTPGMHCMTIHCMMAPLQLGNSLIVIFSYIYGGQSEPYGELVMIYTIASVVDRYDGMWGLQT